MKYSEVFFVEKITTVAKCKQRLDIVGFIKFGYYSVYCFYLTVGK